MYLVYKTTIYSNHKINIRCCALVGTVIENEQNDELSWFSTIWKRFTMESDELHWQMGRLHWSVISSSRSWAPVLSINHQWYDFNCTKQVHNCNPSATN